MSHCTFLLHCPLNGKVGTLGTYWRAKTRLCGYVFSALHKGHLPSKHKVKWSQSLKEIIT